MFKYTCGFAGLATLLAFNVGCAKTYDVIAAPQQDNMEHYVVVQYTKAGGMKLWDCRELPDGERWDPTCVRVQMKTGERENK
jgi:hypothetical protein